MVKHPFPPIKICLEPRKHKNRANMAHVTWRVFITTKQFKQKPRNWVN